MSTNTVDAGRRRFLVASTSVVAAVGAGFVAVPFLSSFLLNFILFIINPATVSLVIKQSLVCDNENANVSIESFTN